MDLIIIILFLGIALPEPDHAQNAAKPFPRLQFKGKLGNVKYYTEILTTFVIINNIVAVIFSRTSRPLQTGLFQIH